MRSQIVGGRYELVRELGVGGMGQVYEGFDQHLRRRIAVKFPHPGLDPDVDWASRFLREAQIMASLSHPGLPAVHDAGVVSGTPDRPYLVMEYIDGVTFDDLLDRHGPLEVGMVAGLGAQAAAALAATHRRRICHRDLKPSNLMLCADATVKVLDFGLAITSDVRHSRYTSTGQTLGTPAFMAPEQVEGRDVGPRTDLYALGLVLYELLTGERVMTGSSPYVVWDRQVNSTPPDIDVERPDVPVEMAQLLMSMIAKAPQDRPVDALAVHEELLRASGDLTGLPEVTDGRSPVAMYARALVAVTDNDESGGVIGESEAYRDRDTAAADFSRGDLHRAVRRARRMADDSRYDAAVAALSAIVVVATPVLGGRDADVVDARIRLADLQREQEDHPAAIESYQTLVDELTADRGPYDDQVMYCQRNLAACEVHVGASRSAIARLERLHVQLEARHGADDPRVSEIGAQIDHLRASRPPR
ncbi:serine/threonine-protein kinase [Nocardia takedensis]